MAEESRDAEAVGSAAAPATSPTSSVVNTSVEIRYLSELALEQIRTQGSTPSFSKHTRGSVTAPRLVMLRDGRELPNDSAQLREKGFVMVPFKSAFATKLENVENPPVYRADGRGESADSEQVRNHYFRECEALVKRLTGADVVVAIQHAVRNGRGSKQSPGVEYLTAYATFAHCDYTRLFLEKAWQLLVKRAAATEDEARSMTYSFINVWQPTTHPVETAPLVLMDWTSASLEEVHHVQLGYNITPKSDDATNTRVNSSAFIAIPSYNPSHRWYMYPSLQVNEALVFTQVDGRPGFATHSFHTSAKHQIKSNPKPRQSIEARFVCGFLPGNPNAVHATSKM